MRVLSFQGFIYRCYTLFVFLLFLNSMYPWYIWGNSLDKIIPFFTAFFSTLLFTMSRNVFIITKKEIGLFFCITSMLIWYITVGSGVIGYFILYVSFIILLFLKDPYKYNILSFITKWFALLLSVSLLFYIFYLLGYSISPSYIDYQGRYPSLNYIFFIISISEADFFRFKSIFMEPGHLTMGLVPLIMANKFNLKNKYVLILFIAELFTFSLAGYITMFLGYLLMNFTIRKFKNIIICALFIAISIFILTKAGFSDMLELFLWNRLDFNTIIGNNRTSAELDTVYNNVMNSSYKWTGVNNINIEAYGDNSGYKKYIVTKGLIGLLLTIITFLYQYFVYRKYLIGVFSLIILLLLYQNAYPFWFAVMSMYILGTSNLRRYSYEQNITLSH